MVIGEIICPNCGVKGSTKLDTTVLEGGSIVQCNYTCSACNYTYPRTGNNGRFNAYNYGHLFYDDIKDYM